MRTVVQRVTSAKVEVEGQIVGEIGVGFVVLVGIEHQDTESDVAAAARKIARLRVFRDADQRMNLSLTDVGGSMLLVSQFTLAGDVRKGRRPSFVGAADPVVAEPLCDQFCEIVAAEGIPVERGIFGADMTVTIINDGPVTLLVDTANGTVV